MHFHYITYMALHNNPFPGDHEMYNFFRPFLGHHNYTLSLSVLRLVVKKQNFKEIMHFHNITYMATPLHKNPCPGGHKIYNFGKFLNCVNVFSLFRYYPHFAFDFCTIYIICHSLKTKTRTSFSKIVASFALFNKIYFL